MAFKTVPFWLFDSLTVTRFSKNFPACSVVVGYKFFAQSMKIIVRYNAA